LLQPTQVGPLERLREHNPLLFDFALKRCVRWQGRGFSTRVFASARHFRGAVS
jgi:mannonate dehydratase